VEEAIAYASNHPEHPDPTAPDYVSWIAWIIVNQLRQKGWKIQPPQGWTPQ